MHYLKTKAFSNNHFMAFKLEAYDRLEWPYIRDTLFYWLDHGGITTVSYSIFINGKNHGYFYPTRGLRQGDHLSLLLHVLCSEGLTHILQASAQAKSISVIRINHNCPTITHLLFADDTIIFSKTTLPAIYSIHDILHSYGILQHTPQEKYLGLPFQILRSKKVVVHRGDGVVCMRWGFQLLEKEIGTLISLIRNFFSEDIQKNLSIPLSYCPYKDRLLWNHHHSAGLVVFVQQQYSSQDHYFYMEMFFDQIGKLFLLFMAYDFT
ncbi:uncharacterized protein LOC126668733 [Mercurialis annua]|uniref:uncharacterized protein LOC126668733 n=1 Tax=Mercurialis annua TaxID=3986 RepID=UPI002160D463|nr:uncharacterized protein LOC126668733 [Mercurialis annua]